MEGEEADDQLMAMPCGQQDDDPACTESQGSAGETLAQEGSRRRPEGGATLGLPDPFVSQHSESPHGRPRAQAPGWPAQHGRILPGGQGLRSRV